MTFYSKLTPLAIITALSCSPLAYAMENEEDLEGAQTYAPQFEFQDADQLNKNHYHQAFSADKYRQFVNEFAQKGYIQKLYENEMRQPEVPESDSIAEFAAYSEKRTEWWEESNKLFDEINEAFHATPCFKTQRPKRRHSVS